MINEKGLRVAKVELFKVPPRWLFVKVTTENGLVGWGEPVVEGRAATVVTAIEEMSSFLIGHPANKIEDFWQLVYRGGFYRGGPVLMSALSGIDQAFWDIKGKALGVPVYELLGGAVRDKVKIYGWVHGDTIEEIAAAAKKRIDNGFTALKMLVTDKLEWIDAPYQVNEAAKRLATVREVIGDKYPIGVDFHGRVHKGMVKMMAKALEPYQPYFWKRPYCQKIMKRWQVFSPLLLFRLLRVKECIPAGISKKSFRKDGWTLCNPI